MLIKKKKENQINKGLRLFNQINEGLRRLRDFIANANEHSLVYFADESSIYSIELFVEMSTIQRGMVGVWSVAFIGGLKVEVPIVEVGRLVDLVSF